MSKPKTNSKSKISQKKVVAGKSFSSINFKDKDQIIDEILCRWWYGLPIWPPENYDYSPIMKEQKLVKVNELTDKNPYEDLKKVIEFEGYPGIFIDSENELYDLRPKDNCPCKSNMEKKTIKELVHILKKCYEGQLKQLDKSKDLDKYFVEIAEDVMKKQKKLCNEYGIINNTK